MDVTLRPWGEDPHRSFWMVFFAVLRKGSKMAKLDGFSLEAGKQYAVGKGASKRLIKHIYNVDMDQWYLQFGSDGWVRLDEYLVDNPDVEIEEVTEDGRQIEQASAPTLARSAPVDVMPALSAPITGDETPSWME